MSDHPLDRRAVGTEPAEDRRPHVDDRAALRFFAFWLANGTLTINLDGGEADYSVLLGPPGLALGELFEHYLAEDHVEGADACAWVRDWAVSGVKPPAVRLPDSAPAWKRVVVDFARDLGLRRLAPDLLGEASEEDWQGLLFEWGGSPLEGVFAVLANCMELDGSGEVVDAGWATRRACWRLAWFMRDDLKGTTPPLEEWETTLWC